jgi:hypothetical protein
MSRSGTSSAIVGFLAVLILLVAPGPGAAHSPARPLPSATPAAPEPPVAELSPAASEAMVSAGPELPANGLPLAVGAGALGLALVIVVGRRWPRRTLAVGLCLLLTIFAYENALHSVHHGFQPQQSENCAVAAAAAHLAAVSVEGVVETIILARAQAAAEPDVSSPVIRLLGPDQGRAPPVLTA